MFRAIVLPIIRSIKLYNQFVLWKTQWVVGRWYGEEWSSFLTRQPAENSLGVSYHKLIIQSNALDDGKNYCPKHVELVWIY